ncbi:prolyl oligopeptidase family serine peptidase [Dehalogenimonas sp. 4OHTPN]|uniref:Prolyl oligopeptidase family serine peptidase n=1 Tax=Dehalogenimonas sp. 4OHTPN TaxID=3166643 RepID=A0AAU8G9P2_9CHLR
MINIRQALDWAASRPELDPEHIGISGVSFGGYVAAIALGLDSRLKAGAILLSAGNLGKLAWSRSSRRYGKWDISEGVFKQEQAEYFKYVDTVTNQGFESVLPSHPAYLFDPYTFVAAIKTKPTLLVNALWDEYFPKEAAREFGEAAGCPEQLWLPTGHATAWLFYPIIRNRVVSLFRNSFNDPN